MVVGNDCCRVLSSILDNRSRPRRNRRNAKRRRYAHSALSSVHVCRLYLAWRITRLEASVAQTIHDVGCFSRRDSGDRPHIQRHIRRTVGTRYLRRLYWDLVGRNLVRHHAQPPTASGILVGWYHDIGRAGHPHSSRNEPGLAIYGGSDRGLGRLVASVRKLCKEGCAERRSEYARRYSLNAVYRRCLEQLRSHLA